jgi:simple sugar transport system substrate-binding protein
MTSSRTIVRSWVAVFLTSATISMAVVEASAETLRDKWCSDVTIRFFAGGAEGDAFASIVYNGARQAEHDLGANVDYVFSGWSSERMIQQLREAVAAEPDGIAMMGHPGNAAIMPLAEQAAAAGIRMMYQNVPVDDVTARFGGAYVGAQQNPQGRALGEEAIRRFGLRAGDVAIVMSDWSQIERAERELGTLQVFEEHGMTVVKLQNPEGLGTDPNVAIPVITAAIAANPDVKIIAYPGGQPLGNAPVYMQAAGKAAGDIINIGFDTSPQIVDAFEGGWVHLTSDQQPFLQGYMPILSICQQVVYGLGAVDVDTGAGFVTPDNYEAVAGLAAEGLR